MALNQRVTLLDGWRGLAVAMVLFGHFFPLPGSELARLGVELFFVLSGRLMAQILIFNHAPLPTFFWRRVTRVYPALIVFVIVVALLAAAGIFSPSRLEYFSVLTVWSNYLFTFAPRQPVFGHTWSLAIEEHCYIILGIVAFAINRKPKAALWISGAIIVSAMVRGLWLTWGQGLGFYEVYWRTDVRIASLFCGFFAYTYHRVYGSHLLMRLVQAKPRHLILFALAVVIQFASVIPDPVKYSLGTIMVAALLIALEERRMLRSADAVAKLLETPWLVRLGVISYSVYLYQQIFHALKEPLPFYMAPLFLIPSLLVGYLSYRFVETPSRDVLNRLWVLRKQRAL
jgi:peptidoglycan/LPS O-acetylase OafA/YrhL